MTGMSGARKDDATSNTITGGIFFHTVVQGRDITVQLPPTITPALSGLPAPASAFTGRDKHLQELLADLAPATSGAGEQRTVLVSAVSGLAGIGKTELAVQTATQALKQPDWFPGGVLFTDLAGYDPERRLSPERALEGLLRALAIPGEHIPNGLEDRQRLYRSVLAAYARENRRILVVVDNASTTAQAGPLLPTDGTTAALVTSRHTLDGLDARLHDLDTLDEAASTAVLDQALRHARGTNDTRFTDDAEAATVIARLCAGLPLALRIAAAILAAAPTRPAASLAAALQAKHTRLDKLARPDRAVRASFDLSYQHLPPDQARLFRLLPLNPGPDLSTDATAHLAATDPDQTEELLQHLAEAHLIEPALVWGRWRMHDLIRAYTRGLAAQDGSEAQQNAAYRLLRYYVAHVEDADDFVRALPGTHHSALLHDRESALAWLDEERLNLVAVVETIAHGEQLDAEIAMSIAMALRQYLLQFRYLDGAVRVMQRVVPLAEQTGRHAEMAVLDCLGSALNALGRSAEAVPLHERVLSLGPGPRELGTVLNNLGNALLGDERCTEAVDAYAQAVDLAADTDDAVAKGMALTNRGRALLKLERYTEAAAVLEEAATLRRVIGDTYGEARTLDVLSAVLPHCGRGEEAIQLSARCAKFFANRGDELSQAIALNNLGRALLETGQTAEAIDTYKRAAELVEPLGEPATERQVVSNLSNALARTGRWTEAIDISSRAASRAAAACDLSAEGHALYLLGQAFNRAGRKAEAIEALTRSVERCAACGDARGEGLALNVLGCVLAEEQRYAEAVEVDLRAVAVFASRGGLTDEIRVMVNLAQALEGEERFAEAIEVYARTADLQAETGDLSGRQATLIVLIDALVRQGRTAETFGVRERVVEVSSALGDRVTECDQLMCMGNLLDSEERFHEAIRVYGRAVGIAVHHRLPDEKFAALNNLGLALIGTGSHQAAVTALQEAAAATALPDRAIALDNLGVALQHLGRYDEAAGAHRHADALYRELGDTCGRGRAHNNLGLAFAHERRFAEAVAAHWKAERLHRTCGEREEEARAYNNGLAALTAWRNAVSENERWAKDRA